MHNAAVVSETSIRFFLFILSVNVPTGSERRIYGTYDDTVRSAVLSADPVSPYAQRMSANGVNEDPRRESVWVAHNNMKLLNFLSSFIALLLIGFVKQSLADLFILAPCGRPLQASQGAAAMQSIEIILLSILMVSENNVFFYMLLEKS